MYAFSLNIRTGTNEQFIGSIMKESAVLDSVLASFNGDSSNSASNFVVCTCSKGERVWIRCVTDGDAVYDNGGRYTTFSGFLLHRL